MPRPEHDDEYDADWHEYMADARGEGRDPRFQSGWWIAPAAVAAILAWAGFLIWLISKA